LDVVPEGALSRYSHVEGPFCCLLSGAEAALASQLTADAAVLPCARRAAPERKSSSLAAKLIEIGGEFRIPTQ